MSRGSNFLISLLWGADSRGKNSGNVLAIAGGPDQRSRRPVLKRPAALLLGLLLLFACPSASRASWLTLSSYNYGPNTSVVADLGQIYSITGCPAGGIDDFIYPYADVYVVPRGSTALTDVSNAEGTPNTLMYVIIDEVIANTAPGGYLVSGDYAVIIDECQDGDFQPGVDWYGAEFSVHIPSDVDPLSSAHFAAQLAATKSTAETAGESLVEEQLATSILFAEFNVITAYSVATDPCDFLLFACTNINYESGEMYCSVHDAISGLINLEQKILNTIANEAFYYKGIAADPPDSNYTALAPLQIPAATDFNLSEPWMDAIVRSSELAEQDAALAEALLHSMERYQGAEQAGNGEYAFVQARLAERYARDLAELAPRLATSIQDIATAAEASGIDFVAVAEELRATQARVASSGLTSDERAKLISNGWTDADIADGITHYLNQDFSGIQTASELSDLATKMAANASTLAAALTDLADAMATEQTALAGQLRLPFPAADAGGPYAVNEGVDISLDATGSSHPDLDNSQLTFQWDLDLDGNFNDASGISPTVNFPRERDGMIGLKVTAPTGYADISYARLTVNNVNSSPIIDSASPNLPLPIGHDESQAYSVTASDPDAGDVLSYSWAVDGVAQAATGNTFTYNASLDAVGEHGVTVTVSDGSPLSADTMHFWRLVVTAPDGDGDGYGSNVDCDDTNGAINPGVAEIYYNGIDDDCNPATPDNPDIDEDGSLYTVDCDDHNPDIHPGATEICNGVDDNCDGNIDEGFDADGDGVTTCAGDCNDGDPTVYLGAPELCDLKDNNCNDEVDEGLDADGDGVTVCAGDCNDSDGNVFPGATEICNGVDDNCDGNIDEGFDTDGDGFTTCGGDCDDSNPATYPGALEICDSQDNNCNGDTDEYVNEDLDGDGFTTCGGDCNDASDKVHPGAAETCNGIDENCDGIVDNLDADGDGYNGCTDDCDDSNADVFPGRPEISMNGLDDDCNPATPDSYAATFMIATDDGGRIYYAKSNGDGTWSDYMLEGILYGTTRGAAIADYDNDDYLDFIVPAWNGSQLDIYFFRNDGTNHFINTGSVGTAASTGDAYGMTAGDYNNDGNEDFIISGNSAYVVVGLGDGKGGFTLNTNNIGSGNGRGIDTADFNHDGNLDFVRATYSSGQVILYLGNGDGTFTNAGIIADPGTDPYAVAAADFDNDGNPDLLANYGSNGDAYFYAGNGDGTFQDGVYVASIDFNNHGCWDNYDYNGDGNQDLITVNYSGRAVRFFPGNGDGTFGEAVSVGTTSSYSLEVTAPPVTTMPPPIGAPLARIFPGRVEDSIGATVDFDGGYSTDDGTIVSYAWDFDDGTTTSGETVTHTFPNAEKDYVVRLTVTDDSGKKSVAAALVRLKDAPPVAAAGGPYTFGEAFASGGVYTVTLDGTGSTDDSSISRYDWRFSDSWTDDFNDGNADGWTFPAGTWNVVNGQLQQTNTGLSRTYALTGTEASGDYEFSADVYITGGSGQEATLAFRAQDSANHYEFIFRGRGYNDFLLYRYINGSASNRLSRALPFTVQSNTTYRLKVRCVGSNIELFVNDSMVGKLTDSTYLNGQVGLVTYYTSALFDNIRVDYLADGATPQHDFKEGTYTADLTVTDSVGQTDSDSATINLVHSDPPVANPGGPYTIDESAANCGQWTLTFDGSGSSDDFGIWKYDWDFGDGTSGTGVNPAHTYSTGGNYTVTLTVTDNALQTHSATTTVTTVAEETPTADPGGPYSFDETVANSGLWTASVNGSGSSDPNGLCDYSWDFGDGGSGNGPTPTHQYNAVGTYTVTLTVRDNALQSHSQTTTVTIAANDPPVADHGGPYVIDENQAQGGFWTASFDASGSTDDFGIWTYDWDFGDSTTGSGVTPTHQYTATGTYPISLTVTDNGRQPTTVETTLTVLANDAPVAEAGPSRVTEVGQPVLLDGTGSTDDVGIYTYQWNFDLPPFAENFSNGIDSSRWAQAGVALVSGEAVITGASSWRNRYLGTRETFTRNDGDSYTGQIRTASGGTNQVMWGLKDAGSDFNYIQFYYAIYFHNNNVQIYEGGASRGIYGTFTDDTDYDLRIAVKDGQGATYYYRPSGSPDWTLLYDSSFSSATTFRLGATIYSGTIAFDNFAGPTSSGPSNSLPAVQVTYYAAGTYHPALTVTDHALQSHSDTTTVTVLQGQAPVADAGGPYSTNEDIPTRFNGRKSTDDFGIKWYEWDFGDDTSLTSRNPFADHRYTAAGSYTATLTVTDFAGQTSVDQATVNVSADPVVACVPWHFSGGIEVPHDTWSGKQITLKGVAWSLHEPLTYTWEFGDGSAPVSGTASNKYKIEAKHTYTGVEGAPFIATLTVTDAEGHSASDNYLVRIRAQSLEIETNVAIDEGLWYLQGKQSRNEESNILYGSWVTETNYTGYYPCATASSVQAFEINGHNELGDVRQDPYTETVSRGLHSLYTYLTSEDIGMQTYGDPDGNGNGIGITVINNSYPIYQGGMVMDAIASSGSPETFADTGESDIKDRSYLDIAQDMIDQYAWGQYDDATVGGGWRYNWNQAPDNSAAQWGAIGSLALKEVFGIDFPDWVKERNKVWLEYSFNGYGFGYTYSGNGIATTPSGMVQMAMDGLERTDPKWIAAESEITKYWYSNWNYKTTNNYYALFALTKALRVAQPAPVETLTGTGPGNGLDWFSDPVDGVARSLIDDVFAGSDGSFTGNASYAGQPMRSAWGIIMLTPTLFVQPPVADAGDDRVWGVDVPITLDGSGSYHLDPFRSIVLYEWDLDGDGTFDTASTDPQVTHTYSSTDYPEATLPRNITVRLRVTDNNDPAKTDTDTAIITIAVPPHPPVADAGGPYSCTAGLPCSLDGSGSFDIDPTDFISAWQWDLNGDFVYGDATGETISTVFVTPGTHNIGLRVLDNAVLNDLNENGVQDPEERLEDFDFATVTVVANLPPMANPGGPYTVDEGSSINLDGSGSNDPNGDLLTYAWDLDNDGAFDDGSGINPAFTGIDDGSYTIALEVNDGMLSNSASTTVTVLNVAPTVDAGPDQTINEGDTVLFAGSFSDPGTQDTHTIEWDFGDTETASGSLTPSHTYSANGSYTVTLTVTDDDGGATSDIMLVTVNDLAPTAAFTWSPEPQREGMAVAFDDQSTSPVDAIVSWQWDFVTMQVTVTEPQNADVNIVFDNHGVYTVRLTVTDADGSTATVTHDVTITDTGPSAAVSGDTLLDEGSVGNYDASGSTAGIDPIVLYEWDWGYNGSSFNPSGETGITQTHAWPDNGVYTVAVRVTDSDGSIAIATLAVTVNNLAPTVEAGPDQNGAVGELLSLPPATFTDPGVNDSHTATIDWGDGISETGTVDQAAKTVSGSHFYTSTGAHTVTVTVTDDDGDSGSDTFVVGIAVTDLCPDDPDKMVPGICGCGVPDTDTDGDGTPDCNDLCPDDSTKLDPGLCGCGISDVDSDGDNTPDCQDGCPSDPTKLAPGICGCGVSDVDSDGDNTPDCQDGCPADPTKVAPGICGCGVSDVDSDGDNTPDCNDLCPDDPNKVEPGACGCGVADTDANNNGVPDCNETAIPDVTDLMARAKDSKIDIVWTHVGAPNYNVYRSTVSGGPYVFIANTTSTYSTYADFGLTNGVTYCYVVRTVDGTGSEVSQSNEACATPVSVRSRTR